MELLNSPNRWSCLATSAAMVLGIKTKMVVDFIGHDGSEILWPGKEDPYCRRAFHIQEIIDVFMFWKRTLTPIEPQPISCPNLSFLEPKKIMLPNAEQRMWEHLRSPGILVGRGRYGNAHAAAWDGNEVFDPMGSKYEITLFQIQTFWKA